MHASCWMAVADHPGSDREKTVMGDGTKQAGEFLSGSSLASRITAVSKGKRVRCAVAFWSADGVDQVFPKGLPRDAKLVCDISMGSTSADALISLGAPYNQCVRHSVGMHAKVFISDCGLVVGSANASASALGGDGRSPPNMEAGTFHAPGSRSWTAAVHWFDELFSNATLVDDEEVRWARLIFRPNPPASHPRKLAPGSLLDLVAAASFRFLRVGFAFTSEYIEPAQNAEVRALAEQICGNEIVGQLDDDHCLFGWSPRDVRRWPEYFILF